MALKNHELQLNIEEEEGQTFPMDHNQAFLGQRGRNYNNGGRGNQAGQNIMQYQNFSPPTQQNQAGQTQIQYLNFNWSPTQLNVRNLNNSSSNPKGENTMPNLWKIQPFSTAMLE